MSIHIPTPAEIAARNIRLGKGFSRVPIVTSPLLARARIMPVAPSSRVIYEEPAGPPNLGSVNRAKFILRGVSERSGLSICEIMSDRRWFSVVWARYEAIYLVKESTLWSLPQIGRFFNRDHTSVINAIRQYEARLKGEKYDRKATFAANRKAAEARSA